MNILVNEKNSFCAFRYEDPTAVIPKCVFLKILSELDIAELSRCAQVNKRWNRLAEDPSLWNCLLEIANQNNLSGQTVGVKELKSLFVKSVDKMLGHFGKFIGEIQENQTGKFTCLLGDDRNRFSEINVVFCAVFGCGKQKNKAIELIKVEDDPKQEVCAWVQNLGQQTFGFYHEGSFLKHAWKEEGFHTKKLIILISPYENALARLDMFQLLPKKEGIIGYSTRFPKYLYDKAIMTKGTTFFDRVIQITTPPTPNRKEILKLIVKICKNAVQVINPAKCVIS